MMKVAVIGAGAVGQLTASFFSRVGNVSVIGCQKTGAGRRANYQSINAIEC
ncbi:hypothetical protein OL548_11710 [Lysinibacillus sp. MHQ-1]|nr:hypothetical protein OL548_11710 [Lysinibacillus sp. MHQ-1]